MTDDTRENEDGFDRPRLKISDAFGEVLCVCGVGILPLALVGLGSIEAGATREELFSALVDPVSKGQLFLYSFSLLGSLVWLLLSQARAYSRLWLGLYATLLLGPGIAAIFFYGKNPQMDQDLNEYIVFLSAAFYVVYVLLYARLLIHFPAKIGSFGESTFKAARETANKSKQYIG